MGVNTQNVICKIMTPCNLVRPISAFRWNLSTPTSLETEAVSYAQNFRNYQPDYLVPYLDVKCETLIWKACQSNLGSSSSSKKILELHFKTFQYTFNSINVLLCVFPSLLPGISKGRYAFWKLAEKF